MCVCSLVSECVESKVYKINCGQHSTSLGCKCVIFNIVDRCDKALSAEGDNININGD